MRRTLVEFTPSRIDPLSAFRCALGIAIPLLGGMLLGQPALGGAAAMGAWSAGLTTFHRDARPRPMLAVLAGAVLGLGVFIGGHTEHWMWVSVLTAMAWCFLCSLLGSLNDLAASTSASLGVAIFLAHGLTVDNTPEQAAVAAVVGGVIQAVIVLLLPRHRHRSERLALAELYHWLGREARELAEDAHVAPSTGPLELAEKVLDTHRHTPEVFLTALTHARRLRAVISAVATGRERVVDADPTAARHLAAVLREAADALDVIGDAIARREEPAHDWHDRLDAAVKVVAEDNRGTYLPIPEWEANRLVGLVRAAAATAATPTVDDPESGRMDPSRWRLRPEVPPIREPLGEAWKTLRANLSWRSTALRQAARTGIAVGIASLGAYAWPGDHGYWLPLTTWLILKPDFAATLGRGIGRTIGTAVGALLAGVLSSLLPMEPFVVAPVVVSFAFIAYLLFQASYPAYSAAVAGFVVFNMELGGSAPLYAAGQRVAATLVGGLFALLYFMAWPKWETPQLGERLAELAGRYADYADYILSRHADPSRFKEGRMRSLLKDLRLSRAEVQSAITRAAAEPVTSPGPMSAEAKELAGDLGWAARPMIALEASLPAVDAPAVPPLDDFRRAVAGVYEELEHRLRGREQDDESLVALRTAYERLVADLADDVTPDTDRQPTYRRRALYRTECETLVTALESIGEQIGRPVPP
ncbi:hypothetical protein Afil01_13330 [Actinorhabdospora filicis]|uniref:Integral membrane bound transporter domain-containing protein n=1 Tax=Actinorhabdospora filicis TaxID=1785913 RepID=A0A9W6SKZ7_9ACTN|nr:hypothetical protein Afil01_13330 [Actinorhabdospora filicis]